MIEIKEILTDNKDLEYIKECAESVGMDVTDRTAFSIPFIAEVMRRMNRSKEVYNKGYKDGQEALAFHLELCKEEGSIIEIPKKVTNGNVMLKLFPNSKYKVVDNGIEFKGIIDDNTEFTTWFPIEWWNSPYRKEQE